MSLVVKVWVDGDPNVDAPLINLSGDSQKIKDAAKKAASGEEAHEILCSSYREAGDLLGIGCINEIKAKGKTSKVNELNSEITTLNALTEGIVSQAKIDALKA
jgi:hypothetical protein